MPAQDVSNAGLDEQAYRAEARSLNRRIAAAAVVVMAELWALTAAVQAWAEGLSESVLWILGLQAVLFALALTVSISGTSSPRSHPLAEPLAVPSPAVD